MHEQSTRCNLDFNSNPLSHSRFCSSDARLNLEVPLQDKTGRFLPQLTRSQKAKSLVTKQEGPCIVETHSLAFSLIPDSDPLLSFLFLSYELGSFYYPDGIVMYDNLAGVLIPEVDCQIFEQ